MKTISIILIALNVIIVFLLVKFQIQTMYMAFTKSLFQEMKSKSFVKKGIKRRKVSFLLGSVYGVLIGVGCTAFFEWMDIKMSNMNNIGVIIVCFILSTLVFLMIQLFAKNNEGKIWFLVGMVQGGLIAAVNKGFFIENGAINLVFLIMVDISLLTVCSMVIFFSFFDYQGLTGNKKKLLHFIISTKNQEIIDETLKKTYVWMPYNPNYKLPPNNTAELILKNFIPYCSREELEYSLELHPGMSIEDFYPFINSEEYCTRAYALIKKALDTILKKSLSLDEYAEMHTKCANKSFADKICPLIFNDMIRKKSSPEIKKELVQKLLAKSLDEKSSYRMLFLEGFKELSKELKLN